MKIQYIRYLSTALFSLMVLLCNGWMTMGQNAQERAREAVLEYNRNDKFINFAYITDVHINGKAGEDYCARPNLEHFVSVCNEGYCDFAVFGGDAYSAYGVTKNEAFRYIGEVAEFFNDIRIPLYATKGNHDRNAKISQEETISNMQYHLLFHNQLDRNTVRFNPDDPYGNYFYVDYVSEKVRIINLNYYDAQDMQKPGIHDKQLTWVGRYALNFNAYENPSEWTVVFFVHHYKHCGDRFWKIIEEKRHKTGMKIAGFIYGDSHFDQFSIEYGINMVGVMCGYCTPEESGTLSEDSFSVFTVDTKNNCLRETRIGRGKDRCFPFQ